MHRRRFVGLAGAAVLATAGCLDGPADTPDSTDRPSLPDGVSIGNQAVQPGVVTLATPDSLGVRDDAGQYLLVDVELGGDGQPAPADFELAFDGETYTPEEFTQPLYRDGDLGVGYTNRDPGGLLVFALPETGDASTVRVDVADESWTPSDRTRSRLTAPLPSFEVDFSAPDSVDSHESPTLTLSVTNTGDTPGTAVLALNRVGPNVAYAPERDIHWDLDAGETKEASITGRAPENGRDVRYHLRGTGTDRQSRTIGAAEDGDSSE